MRVLLLAAIAGAGLTLATPGFALGLGEAGELEHARANARAGGPVSERDFELLERWGCTSGTNNPVCNRGRVHSRAHDNSHYKKPRRQKRWVE